ncbi:MAG: hypothetical protein JWP89_6606 [Schlesneria sp.]|nr:hypothetical protein [Schlesneria sp.]
MSLLKSSLLVLVAASSVVVSGMSAEAQNRTTHRTNTNQGMSGGVGGTSPTQSSIQSAQNQARSIAARQHQIWLANRLKKNAAERAAKANGTDTKTVKSTDSAKSTTETTTKPTSTTTSTTTTTKPATK